MQIAAQSRPISLSVSPVVPAPANVAAPNAARAAANAAAVASAAVSGPAAAVGAAASTLPSAWNATVPASNHAAGGIISTLIGAIAVGPAAAGAIITGIIAAAVGGPVTLAIFAVFAILTALALLMIALGLLFATHSPPTPQPAASEQNNNPATPAQNLAAQNRPVARETSNRTTLAALPTPGQAPAAR